MTTQNGSLRLLIVGVGWPPETFLARLTRGLAERGNCITLATAAEPDATWRSMVNVDFLRIANWTGSPTGRVARIGYGLGSAALRSPGDTAWVATEARRQNMGSSSVELLSRWLPFAGGQWDVVYFPWNVTAYSYLPLMDRLPGVISCRGAQINVAPHNPDKPWLADALARSFDKAAAIHCVSQAICEEATRYGLDHTKATVIRPAVDPDVFHPGPHVPSADGSLRVITTGSIVWRKGYEYALSALKILKDRDLPVRLEIIGSGDENLRLLFTINDLGLSDIVTWQGRLRPAEVVARLQQSDVFLLSSLSEGISNAVLEAMACGLPVVTTDVGGMDEAVTDGVEGLVVPPRDPIAIADAVAYLWARPEMRRHMGQAGRERVVADFSLEDQVTAFEDLFRSVAK